MNGETERGGRQRRVGRLRGWEGEAEESWETEGGGQRRVGRLRGWEGEAEESWETERVGGGGGRGE